MANEHNPNEPHRSTPTNEELIRQRAERLENELRDNELQADPELAEGPASGGRLALFAIAIVAILGVVFYGLNNGSMNPNNATSTAMRSAPSSPGQTTGSAPTTPQQQPGGQSSPANSGAPSTGAPAK
ncbi:uncharacterized protein HemX [Nitrobacteraceae bacterium AZCC 1564]